MKYTKIKQGTEAWELMNNIFTFKKQWGDNAEAIESFLGFAMDNQIAFEISNLWVDSAVLKKHKPEWVEQFKKCDYGITSAKANSKVGKEWKVLCERLGMKTYKTRGFTMKYGLMFTGNLEFQNMNNDYFITTDNDKYDFEVHEWAEPMGESEFLRTRADFLDKKDKTAIGA